ncbi:MULTISPECIES: hypothetical protein [unclassified Streptomyces]
MTVVSAPGETGVRKAVRERWLVREQWPPFTRRAVSVARAGRFGLTLVA